MNLLGLDIETTGLDSAADDVLEIAAVIWNVERKRPVQFYNWMVRATVPPKITEITGIEQGDADLFGLSPYGAAAQLDLLLTNNPSETWDAIVTHNGVLFDIPFLEAWMSRCYEPGYKVPGPVIDTRLDLPMTDAFATRKLEDLAANHEIVNPFPHRALTDVLTMMLVVQEYDIRYLLDKVIVSPLLYIVTTAKSPSFYWWPAQKLYRRPVRQIYAATEVKQLAENHPPAKFFTRAIPDGEH